MTLKKVGQKSQRVSKFVSSFSHYHAVEVTKLKKKLHLRYRQQSRHVRAQLYIENTNERQVNYSSLIGTFYAICHVRERVFELKKETIPELFNCFRVVRKSDQT